MEGKNVILRCIEPYDIDVIYRWENDESLWETTSVSAPYSVKVIEDYIANYNPDIFVSKQLRLIVELKKTNEVIGSIDLYDFDPVNNRLMIGFLIEKKYRREGYATEAVEIALGYCFDRLGVHTVGAIASSDNEASRKLLETMGFKINGRFRSWIRRGNTYCDAYFYQKLI